MKIKRIISVLLAAVMLLSVVSVSAFAAENETVSIYFTMSAADMAIQKHKLTVASGTAKKYGYTVSEKDHNNVAVDGVTVFDAVVAAHEELYGDSFTAETKDDYLVMVDGFIKKSFGKATSSASFMVNGIMPNDGIINPKWGSYTSYAADTAVLNDGDDVCYFFYKDTTFYSDYYTWFDSNSYTADENEEFTVNLSGYCAMYYGVNDWQTIVDDYAMALQGVEVYTMIDGEKVLLGTTDENGNLTIKFEKSGEYVLFCDGETIDEFDDEAPVVTTYSVVNVSSDEPENNDIANNDTEVKYPKWVYTVKNILSAIIELFKTVFEILGK